MNISDFERLLREGSEPQHFPPEEDKWLKLEEDLKNKKRRGLVIALPKPLSWAVAASILLLISIGLYNRYTTAPQADAEIAVKKPQQPSMLSRQYDTAMMQTRPQLQEVVAGSSHPAPAQRSHNTNTPERKQEVPQVNEAVLQRDTVALVKEKTDIRTQELPKPEQQPKQQRKQDVLPEPDNTDFDIASRERKINFGVSALYGLSDVSKGQYRVSVDARRNLSKRVFANVQLIASTATVTNSTSYEYQVIGIGPPGIGVLPENTTQQVEANYSGNIYTLGLSPSIGFRVTRKVALSTGPDIQKRVGGSMSLVNGDAFRNQITNQSLVDEKQQVAALDFGLQSAAQVDVSRRLALTLLYRYGLTNYLEKTEGATRNSFMSVGLSYQFIR